MADQTPDPVSAADGVGDESAPPPTFEVPATRASIAEEITDLAKADPSAIGSIVQVLFAFIGIDRSDGSGSDTVFVRALENDAKVVRYTFIVVMSIIGAIVLIIFAFLIFIPVLAYLTRDKPEYVGKFIDLFHSIVTHGAAAGAGGAGGYAVAKQRKPPLPPPPTE